MKRFLIYLYRLYWNHLHWRSFILNRFHWFSLWMGSPFVLRLLGARIGTEVTISGDLILQNARRGSCANLTIGNHVYIGPRCLFDLASTIEIQDDSAISADVKLVTHSDVGHRPLCKIFPRKEGAIVIGRGAWIGVSSTVLHGVTIGSCSVVGAMSLVNKSTPEHSVCFGIPAKVVRTFEYSEETR